VLRALEQGGRALGVALDGISATLNPNVVVLGGYLGLLCPSLLTLLRAGVDERTAVGPFAPTQVVTLASSGTDRVAEGAGLAARDAVLRDPLHLTRVL
jgi:predicted NBD/HSP70 family sugar kinase